MGQLKATKAIGKRPGKGPLSMAKELALEEVSGNGAAVNGNEGRIGPSTLRVNKTGDDFLTGPALTANQQRRGRPRHLIDEGTQALHRRRGADER